MNCGVKGWGWQDNGYGANVLGTPVRFAASGTHTLRVQRREDGFAFDQIVLSSSRYFTSSPGPLKEASTVLARSNGQAAPTDSEIVLHMTERRPMARGSRKRTLARRRVLSCAIPMRAGRKW